MDELLDEDDFHRTEKRLKLAEVPDTMFTTVYYLSSCSSSIFTSDNAGGKCDCPRCLSVCLLARLLINACTDIDDILRVDRCRDMDELINF